MALDVAGKEEKYYSIAKLFVEESNDRIRKELKGRHPNVKDKCKE